LGSITFKNTGSGYMKAGGIESLKSISGLLKSLKKKEIGEKIDDDTYGGKTQR
jgi:hypothetical protein